MKLRLRNTLVALREGIHYGYPLCCVLHFAFDFLIKDLPFCADYRGGSEDDTHVPCGYHKWLKERRGVGDKEWVVAQDMSPFGLRIDSWHWTRLEAERKAHSVGRSDVEAMPLEYAHYLDRQIVERAASAYGFSADEVLGD